MEKIEFRIIRVEILVKVGNRHSKIRIKNIIIRGRTKFNRLKTSIIKKT